jgi:large subunit ribosomal protein L17
MNSLIMHGKIETTEAKAKEIRPKIEKLITKAKADNLANKRLLRARLRKETFQKLIKELRPRYKERKGGYTRIIKLSPRKGDRSRRAIIEFV